MPFHVGTPRCHRLKGAFTLGSHLSLQWWCFVGKGLLLLVQHDDQLLLPSGCSSKKVDSAKKTVIADRFLFAECFTLVTYFVSPQPS